MSSSKIIEKFAGQKWLKVRRWEASIHPKGMKIIEPRVAGNELPWVNEPQFINSERVASIPNVSFVEFDFVTFQKITKLILKRNLPMMLLLSGDVIPHCLDL